VAASAGEAKLSQEAHGTEQALVNVRADSSVRGPEIRLGEIAEIRANDPRLGERLGAVEVGRAPLPGLSRTLDQAYLKTRLRLAKVDLSQVALDLPPSISVSTASQTITGADLLAVAREAVIAARQEDAGRLLVLPGAAPPMQFAVPAGRLKLQARPRPGAELLGSISLPVEVWIDDTLQRTVYLPVKVALLTEVLVAVRALPRGTPIGADDVRIERREIGSSQEPLRDLTALAGRQAARSIAAGEVLLPNLVEQPALVKRGDMVILTAEGRGLRAVTQGEAREDGKEGQVIRIRNLTSNREVYGQVDGPRSVRILF
jgi:flagella basal body P-ring formation protein FlgA